MESVYIETTIVSYLVARTKEGTLARQWQDWTRDWWQSRRPALECVTSPEVLREAEAGDKKMSQSRLEELRGLRLLVRTPAVDEMANTFLNFGPLPQKAKADAAHLAFATVYGVNYLLTWNLRHLANAVIQSKLRPIARERG